MNEQLLRFAVEVLRGSHIAVHQLRNDQWTDPVPFDLGLREGIWGSKQAENLNTACLSGLERAVLYHCTDEFGCLYSLLRLPSEEVLFVGPLLCEEDPDALCRQAAQRYNLPAAKCRQLQDYYLRLPHVSPLSWYHAFMQALVRQLFGNQCRSQEIHPEQLRAFDPAGSVKEILPMEKPLLSIGMLEDRYTLENRLLEAVRHGDAESALWVLQSYSGVTVPEWPGRDKITSMQLRLAAFNGLLRKEAEHAEVHPFYLDILYNEFLSNIPQVRTCRQENQLLVEMLRQYCDRVRRYSAAWYSPVVRKVMYYINANLKENLSLRILAARFNVSRSYLSSLFRRETGSTLTDYVNATRVEYAANLLLYHQYSVLAAAQEAGFSDVSYFTRQFKRIMGLPPVRYIKTVHPLAKDPEGQSSQGN